VSKTNLDNLNLAELKRELKALSSGLVIDALIVELWKASKNPKYESMNGCIFAKLFLANFATKYGLGIDKLLEDQTESERRNLSNETIKKIR
jgi:hypothetical protein